MLDRVVVFIIYTNDEGAIISFTRSCNQYFLRTSFKVLRSSITASKDASGFNNQINIPCCPRQVFWVTVRYTLDSLTIDSDGVVIGADISIEFAQHGVISEQVGIGFWVRGIVNSDYFNMAIFSADPASHEVTSDASKAVDRYSNHCVLPSVILKSDSE